MIETGMRELSLKNSPNFKLLEALITKLGFDNTTYAVTSVYSFLFASNLVKNDQ